MDQALLSLRARARQRFIGAIVLVSIALALLWFVLDDGPPERLSERVTLISAAPTEAGLPTENKVSTAKAVAPRVPITPKPATNKSTQPTPAPQVLDPQLILEDKIDVASLVPVQPHFYLQVGAFAEKDKAQLLMEKVQRMGFQAEQHRVKQGAVALTRLRVAPFAPFASRGDCGIYGRFLDDAY